MYAIIRQDGQPSLIVDGLMSLEETNDGRVSDHPTASNRFIVDGRLLRPRLASIDAYFSPRPLAPGVTQGAQRIIEVRAFLTEVKDGGVVCNIQAPNQPLMESMALETFSFTTDRGDAVRCQMRFKEVRRARTQQVELSAVTPRRGAGGPRGEVAAGVAKTEEKGAQPLKSIAATALDGGLSAFGLGL